MLAANVFPPIPSSVILTLARSTPAQWPGSLWVVPVAGPLGPAGGAGLVVSCRRLVGPLRAVGGSVRRMVPGVRTLISVPAGVSGMPLGPFLVSTLTGSAIWTVILVLAGYELGERYSQVASVIEPVSNAVLALAVIWYLWRVATFGRSRGDRKSTRLHSSH